MEILMDLSSAPHSTFPVSFWITLNQHEKHTGTRRDQADTLGERIQGDPPVVGSGLALSCLLYIKTPGALSIW